MRGDAERQANMLLAVTPDSFIPEDHPIRRGGEQLLERRRRPLRRCVAQQLVEDGVLAVVARGPGIGRIEVEDIRPRTGDPCNFPEVFEAEGLAVSTADHVAFNPSVGGSIPPGPTSHTTPGRRHSGVVLAVLALLRSRIRAAASARFRASGWPPRARSDRWIRKSRSSTCFSSHPGRSRPRKGGAGGGHDRALRPHREHAELSPVARLNAVTPSAPCFPRRGLRPAARRRWRALRDGADG